MRGGLDPTSAVANAGPLRCSKPDAVCFGLIVLRSPRLQSAGIRW